MHLRDVCLHFENSTSLKKAVTCSLLNGVLMISNSHGHASFMLLHSWKSEKNPLWTIFFSTICRHISIGNVAINSTSGFFSDIQHSNVLLMNTNISNNILYNVYKVNKSRLSCRICSIWQFSLRN